MVQFHPIALNKGDMTTKTKTTEVTIEQADEDGFRAPGNFYIVNAFGNLLFVSAKKRQTAQRWVDSEYGDNKYQIRLWKI